MMPHPQLLHACPNGITVSTVDLTSYGSRYETAYMHNGDIEVIETYDTSEAAARGHAKHVLANGGKIEA